jgi:hypothetical protein
MLSTLVLLSSFAEFMAQQLTERVDEGVDSVPRQEVVEYQGRTIQFTHQYWRIQAETICADRQQQKDYPLCRQQAKALFATSCQRLSDGTPEDAESPLRAMYCAAATASAETVSGLGSVAGTASVAASAGTATTEPPLVDLQQGKRDCNRLRFKAMLSDDPQLRAERDRVCGSH